MACYSMVYSGCSDCGGERGFDLYVGGTLNTYLVNVLISFSQTSPLRRACA